MTRLSAALAGTHFQSPRYLKLVEQLGAENVARVIETLSEFCDRRLGQGRGDAKDTPILSPSHRNVLDV